LSLGSNWGTIGATLVLGVRSRLVQIPPRILNTQYEVNDMAVSIFLRTLKNGAERSHTRAQVTTEKTKSCFLFAGISSFMQARIIDWAQETAALGMVAMIIHRLTFRSASTGGKIIL